MYPQTPWPLSLSLFLSFRPSWGPLFPLVHSLNQLVDELLTVTEGTTLDEVLELSWDTPTTRWVRQLEWPQEVVGLLEVWTNGNQLVDQVVNGHDTELTEVSLDDGIVGESNSLLVDLTVTSLVNQLSDGGVRWVTVSNVWLNELQQLRGSLGDLDEGTSVDLSQSQKLQNLSWLWWDLVDTLDSDNEDQLWLSVDVVGARSLSVTSSLDDGSLGLLVLLLVGSVSGQDDCSLLLVSLFGNWKKKTKHISYDPSIVERTEEGMKE